MASLTTASLTTPDTLVKIRFHKEGISGMSWNGKEYGPGGKANGFNGGDTVEVPAWTAARWVGKGRAVLVDEDEPGATEPGVIESRDPAPRRGR